MPRHVPFKLKIALDETSTVFRKAGVMRLREAAFAACKYRSAINPHRAATKIYRAFFSVAPFNKGYTCFFHRKESEGTTLRCDYGFARICERTGSSGFRAAGSAASRRV
jgi:hypothetical protein